VNYFLNPTYFKPMITTSLGHMMLLYAFVSLVLGHLVVRRIVRLDV
jgi:Flp pilus assembly protein TadB